MVVEERLGIDEDEALTLGRAVAWQSVDRIYRIYCISKALDHKMLAIRLRLVANVARGAFDSLRQAVLIARRELRKVGLATIEGGRLLVVRKRGTRSFILPGGKPEGAEQDLETLSRELNEELQCSVSHIHFEGAFTDVAADLNETIVTVRLYAGKLLGNPHPASEIEEIAWISLTGPHELPLAPSLTNKILPHLNREQNRLRRRSPPRR